MPPKRLWGVAEKDRDGELLAVALPESDTSMMLTNERINAINAGVHAAKTVLDTAEAAHKEVPARVPLAQVDPDRQVLDTETKLIHHAIGMAAFNTATYPARAVATGTGFVRAEHQAQNLARTMLTTSGAIIPDHDRGILHIRLDPLPAPRHTAAIAELCQALNDTNTVYPDTTLTLRYTTKPHHQVHIYS